MDEKKTQKKTAKFINNFLNVRIKELLQQERISAESLSKALDVSAEAVRLWLSGYNRPDIDKVCLIAKYFNCTTDYLLGLSPVKNNEHKNILENTESKFSAILNELDLETRSVLITIFKEITETYIKIAPNKELSLEYIKLLDKIYWDCFNTAYLASMVDNNSDLVLLHRYASISKKQTQIIVAVNDFFQAIQNCFERNLPNGYDIKIHVNPIEERLNAKAESVKE